MCRLAEEEKKEREDGGSDLSILIGRAAGDAVKCYTIILLFDISDTVDD